MRCSTATLVLSTLAIGQAAAGTIRHAGFHARRAVEQKRSADEAAFAQSVDWKKVAEETDWSTVTDWSKVNYGGGNAGNAPAPSEVAEAPSAPAAYAAASTPTEAAEAPAYTPSKVESVKEEKTAEPKANKNKDLDISSKFVNGIVEDVKSWFTGDVEIAAVGENSKGNNGLCWLGDDGTTTATFTNDHAEDVMLLCWENTKFTVNVNKPLLSVVIPQGKAQKVSFGSFSGACSPVPQSQKKSHFGGVYNTWFELTVGDKSNGFPTYDVSREPNMQGVSISSVSKETGCVSDMEQCVFKCTSSNTFCGEEGTYELMNTSGKGCHGDLTNGGCMAGTNGDHLDVVIS